MTVSGKWKTNKPMQILNPIRCTVKTKSNANFCSTRQIHHFICSNHFNQHIIRMQDIETQEQRMKRAHQSLYTLRSRLRYIHACDLMCLFVCLSAYLFVCLSGCALLLWKYFRFGKWNTYAHTHTHTLCGKRRYHSHNAIKRINSLTHTHSHTHPFLHPFLSRFSSNQLQISRVCVWCTLKNCSSSNDSRCLVYHSTVLHERSYVCACYSLWRFVYVFIACKKKSVGFLFHLFGFAFHELTHIHK